VYVVTVNFTIRPGHVEEFRAAMRQQASASLEREPDCHQFDVALDPDDPATVFLYERYTDRAAFEAHLRSRHFTEFDTTVASWLAAKTVHAYRRDWPRN